MADQSLDKPKREVSEPDKRLAADWLKRVEAAVSRFEDEFKRFETNRRLLRGIDTQSGKRMLANLHFANLAMMRPQVYAKDPEFSVRPSRAVPETELKAMQRFAETAEALLTEKLVKRAQLKKRAKRLLTSAYATSVGWWKVCWQEDPRTDPMIASRIKDTQDNLQRLERMRSELDDPAAGQSTDLKLAELREMLAGLQAQAEVSVSRGLTVDFVLSEDVIVLDDSVLEVGDYNRAGAIAHRVWMTREQYKERFCYAAEKGKPYTAQPTGTPQSGSKDPKRDLLCTYEIWDQASSRVLHVCDGEEGFCRSPFTPDWTGERWYPFFMAAFNEVEGQFYPLSDIELTEQLVRSYNETRTDFTRDRKYALPLNIIRKGGSLTDEDVKKIANREGGDTILVEGVGGQPISNDIWSGQLAAIRSENYNTQPDRSDMEMLIGGGDAARGSVLEAKTATEAEILSQGLRGRSAERQDVIEDMLSEVGNWALQIMLRKMSEQEVQEIAGPDSAWPAARSPEDVFKMVTVDVRGGSTGKPDRLQEQDRWTKLLPVMEKAMAQVAELRAQPTGEQQAQAITALVKETLRRFDERIDFEQFLPAPKDGEQAETPDAMQDPRVQALVQQGQQMVQEMQAQIQQLQQQLADKEGDRQVALQQAQINAERDVQIAREKAPIEAQAKVEVAMVTAQAQAEARREAEAAAAAQKASESEQEPPEPEEEGPSETQQVLQYLVQAQQDMQALLGALVAPKPRMRLVHSRDPNTNRIAQSELVPVEAQEP